MIKDCLKYTLDSKDKMIKFLDIWNKEHDFAPIISLLGSDPEKILKRRYLNKIYSLHTKQLATVTPIDPPKISIEEIETVIRKNYHSVNMHHIINYAYICSIDTKYFASKAIKLFQSNKNTFDLSYMGNFIPMKHTFFDRKGITYITFPEAKYDFLQTIGEFYKEEYLAKVLLPSEYFSKGDPPAYPQEIVVPMLQFSSDFLLGVSKTLLEKELSRVSLQQYDYLAGKTGKITTVYDFDGYIDQRETLFACFFENALHSFMSKVTSKDRTAYYNNDADMTNCISNYFCRIRLPILSKICPYPNKITQFRGFKQRFFNHINVNKFGHLVLSILNS